ncbi:hypothetical protein KIL84_014242 [Mauremys mutica]|uniref:PCNA-associated factor n=1 Tax=Mauremys mutica TaxID=74926 RepID=A0A9D3XPD7_9SAUR|nr:hypothetical protein KIL84_014242 [Mauremys mutica]
MVRTKADCGGAGGAYRKVVAARAPRKALGSSSANAGPSPPAKKVESKYAGGNPVCVRPTPTWQKGIGEFFGQSSRHAEKENQMPDDEEAGSSGIGRLAKNLLCSEPLSSTEAMEAVVYTKTWAVVTMLSKMQKDASCRESPAYVAMLIAKHLQSRDLMPFSFTLLVGLLEKEECADQLAGVMEAVPREQESELLVCCTLCAAVHSHYSNHFSSY